MGRLRTRAKLARLEARMAAAPSYAAWRAAALEVDELTGAARWRRGERSDDLDAALIRARLAELRELRRGGEARRLMFALHEGLHGNLGNMANPALYERARVGTLRLIDDYLDEVVGALESLCDGDHPSLSLEERTSFFRRTGKCFGRSALLLSGGATFGFFHLGVLESLCSAGLLPRVISGSSAGAIIAGFVGTHDEAAVHALVRADARRFDPWRRQGLRAALRGEGWMSSEHLESFIEAWIPDLTFEQAFERTGRIINISVSPADANQHARILNYLTAPNVLVRRAALASCAIPGVFRPVTLYARDFDGRTVPYMPSSKWVDGSIGNDLPMLRLSRMHNVNHYIVSQTNVNRVPLLSHGDSDGRLTSIAHRALSSAILGQAQHVAQLAGDHLGLQSVRSAVDAVGAMARQRSTGDVTIVTTRRWTDLRHAVANPSPELVARLILEGQRATWPHLERIRNATRLSRCFEDCLGRLEARARQREDERAAIDRRGPARASVVNARRPSVRRRTGCARCPAAVPARAP